MQGTLYPYLETWGKKEDEGVWVFDDPRKDLKAEAFVMGMSEMIDKIVAAKRIPKADKGFAMTFGDEPIPGADVELHWVSAGELTFKDEDDKKHHLLVGNWYEGTVAGEPMAGWLCPALLKYFESPPAVIYAKAEPLPKGVDPIWHNPPKKKAKAFVQAKYKEWALN